MKQITPTALAAWLADASRAKPLLLDVREPWEHQTARIEGSKLVPLGEVAERLGELDQQQEVVAICHHGGRRLPVAMVLEEEPVFPMHQPFRRHDALAH